jgi:GH24 family phage-related lysozyme (muramidase)
MRFINFDSYDNLKSVYYLNKAINECKLLVESNPAITSLILENEGGPHYEWDFTTNKFYDRINNIESDIEKSASYVRTAEQGITFIKNLTKQIVELPDKIKSDFIKIAIAAMAINLSYNQLTDVDTKVNSQEQTKVVSMINYELDKQIEKKELIKKNEPVKKINNVTTYSDNLVNFLKWEEGDAEIKGAPKRTAYAIGDGMVTIGYGHAEPIIKTVRVGGDKKSKSENYIEDVTKISSGKAEELLRSDIEENAKYIMYYIVNKFKEKKINIEITQPMFDAMVSLSFNHGIGNLINGPFMDALERGDVNAAAETIKSLGVSDEFGGISKRRQKEYQMFKYGKYPK